MSAKGTSHHKAAGLTGWGMIIGLPFAVACATIAVSKGLEGFSAWLSSTVSAAGFFAFFSAAIWYCKLQFDEVILDYFDGGFQKFCLLLNRIVPFIIWALLGYALYKLSGAAS